MKELRSSLSTANLQEVLDASTSAKRATLVGQAQYETPAKFADYLAGLLPACYVDSIFDPQCASGNLLKNGFGWSGRKLGFEIDNRFRTASDGVLRVHGNCVTAWEIMDDVFPDLRFQCQVANPPFSIGFKVDGVPVDSTLYTWKRLMGKTAPEGFGYYIANASTIDRLELDKHPRVYLYQKFPVGVFPNVNVAVGVLHWHNSEAWKPELRVVEHTSTDPKDWHVDAVLAIKEHYKDYYAVSHPGSSAAELVTAFNHINQILEEETRRRPAGFNIWLDRDGSLDTYLSTREGLKRKLTREDVLKLSRIKDCHPITLTTDRETRKLLAELVGCGFYTIQPEAEKAIKEALVEAIKVSAPIMPITEHEHVAHADEDDTLVCHQDWPATDPVFTMGRKYELSTACFHFTDRFTRTKFHQNEDGGMYALDHTCQLSGTDRYILIRDDHQVAHRFMDRPPKDSPGDHDERLLWDIFEKPKVDTIAEKHPDKIEKNTRILKASELWADFTYYPGQLDYLARVACKDYGLIAAETGCHAKGAPILMADGTVKKVEDVGVSERVMGWDGTPRPVESLSRGRDRMFRLTPVKGDSMIVNLHHVLTLVHTTSGKVVDVSVKEYLGWCGAWKHNHKLFRAAVDCWPEQYQPLEPYFVGLILGDGHTRLKPNRTVSITKPDREIRDYILREAAVNGWGVRTSRRDENNPTYHFKGCASLHAALDAIGISDCRAGTKFVPAIYKVASRRQRLELLAGLMDTDGHMVLGGFDYISKSQQLAEDVTFMARSVGLAAYVTPCVKGFQNGFTGDYFRVSISGDCAMIPTLIARKRCAVRRQKKSVLRTGFKLQEIAADDFYGFTITGDGRYLMGDFTVTHNCGKTLCALSLIQVKGPQRALIIAPQATMRADEEEDADEGFQTAAQWVAEIRRFCPGHPVFELFSLDDYRRIRDANEGQLPPGIYVSYFDAIFGSC